MLARKAIQITREIKGPGSGEMTKVFEALLTVVCRKKDFIDFTDDTNFIRRKFE
jgi:hypothetical protein